MDGDISTPAGGTPTPEPLPQAMAGNGDAGATPPVETPVHAAESVIAFGGLRGGRERIDGLVPGSAEAKDADRLYDRVRKWCKNHPNDPHAEENKLPPEIAARILGDVSRINRAEERERLRPRPAYLRRPGTPAPLPSLPPVAEARGGESVDIQSLAAATSLALENWAGTDIEPLLEELLALLKDLLEMQRERRMLAAQLPPELAKEILEDKWPPRAEALLCKYGSRLLAKLANSVNLPLAYKDEIFGASGLLIIVGHEMRKEHRILKAIVALKKNPSPK